jgi:hypothetical protein
MHEKKQTTIETTWQIKAKKMKELKKRLAAVELAQCKTQLRVYSFEVIKRQIEQQMVEL